MIPHNVSTITRHAYNLPVTFHRLVLRYNSERLRLKRIELNCICVEVYRASVRQYICVKVVANFRAPVNNALGDALSNDSDYNDGWLDI